MNFNRLWLGLFGFFLLLCIPLTPAHAQASRTWISGVGDDVNPCSRTAPCKTFAGAISKTLAGGEIDCLDPGGFGAVTITKAITLDCSGTLGSVLVSGTNGIVVQAGASDKVILRGISINGVGAGINGIRFLAGAQLTVEKCMILGFTTQGIDIALGASGNVFISNTVITNIKEGIRAATTAGNIEINVVGTLIEGPSLHGFDAGAAPCLRRSRTRQSRRRATAPSSSRAAPLRSTLIPRLLPTARSRSMRQSPA